MGLIKSLIELNTLAALNNINQTSAIERKKARRVSVIRSAIERHPDYKHVGLYIIRVTSGEEVHYWKFTGNRLDNICEDIYNFLKATNKTLHRASFKYSLVRIQ